MPELIQRLEFLGFTTYEAKAYCALLRKYPANAYEISKLAQIPPSKIYETMQKLKNREAVLDSQSEPIKYLPVKPDILLRRIQQETDHNIQFLLASLPNTPPVENFDITWNLKGETEINAKLLELAGKAHHEIYASIWPQQYAMLYPSLLKAKLRGVQIVLASFGECPPSELPVYNLESCAIKSLDRLGSQISTVVVDSSEVVIGEIAASGMTSKGVWTKTPSIILVAKEYIRHDILVNHLVQEIGREQYDKLCKEDPVIRYIQLTK